jgi:hypothetical protein
MARPQKPDDDRRTEQVKIRLTVAEKATLETETRKAGLALADYVRRVALGHRVGLAYGPKPADPALVTEINKLALQLSALGNLANQVALYAHTERTIPDSWATLPDEIRQAQAQASAALAHVVRTHAR